MKNKPLSPRTQMLYAANQRHFGQWCKERGLDDGPPSPEQVAVFLREVLNLRGPTSAIQHASALGSLYRSHGEPFNVKIGPVGAVLKLAKARTSGLPTALARRAGGTISQGRHPTVSR